MRKAFTVLATIVAMALIASGAWAYTYDNNTLVQPYNGTTATGAAWQDVIGATNVFETYGADYVSANETLTIYTNWGPNDIGHLGAVTADLFVDIDPANNDGFDYAIKMTGIAQDTSGNTISPTVDIVSISSYQTSVDKFSASGNTYGGRYDLSNGNVSPPVPGVVPVDASGTDVGITTVVWTNIAGTAPDWTIAFVLGDIPGFDDESFAFLWATGTCANDTSQGGNQPGFVPLPPSVLLLGSGLLGLGLLGFRRRNRGV